MNSCCELLDWRLAQLLSPIIAIGARGPGFDFQAGKIGIVSPQLVIAATLLGAVLPKRQTAEMSPVTR